MPKAVYLEEALKAVRPPDREAMALAKRRLDSIIKPLGSLGKLEGHLIRIAGITGAASFDLSRKAVVVFCADNGVVAQGISQSGSEVTAIVAENMVTGDTCVCHMAKVAGADVIPVDVGMAADLDLEGLRVLKTARGTADLSRGPAMTREQAVEALEAGINLALELKEQGYRMLATGEMGIGNTTTSAAVAAALLDKPAALVAGRGSGLSDEALERKIQIIDGAVARIPRDPQGGIDPLEALARVGGFDIAGMAGLCIGGGMAEIPVVLDGLISCVAALVACRLAPALRERLLPSHVTAEPAGVLLLEELGLSPLLDADMGLGEGSGAVATFPLYDMILSVYHHMVAFADEDMEAYVPL